MRKFLNIDEDKWKHGIICCALTIICYLLTGQISFAIFVALTIGVAKEVYDSFSDSNYFDGIDLVADLIGILVGMLLIAAGVLLSFMWRQT